MHLGKYFSQFRLVLFVFTVAVVLSLGNAAWAAKNVIIMVSDGAGFNTWIAADMHQGKLGKQVYDRPGWVKFGCTTFPLNRSGKPTGDENQDPTVVYDPAEAWDATPLSEKPGDFAGYKYLKTTATDSAASGTALATGQKTYNGAINWSNEDRPMLGRTIAEIAKAAGKSAGVATSVTWSHATPAALGGAHNRSRGNCEEIAREMLDAARLDVIMGAGHPEYDINGRPIPDSQKFFYKAVGGKKVWNALKAGELPWTLIESKEDFAALAGGATPPKVLGTVQVAATLQQQRTGLVPIDDADGKKTEPAEPPMNENVLSLADMTAAALNCLDANPNGFYLMIEGGAVDWANHANRPRRMIEEQTDFIRAIEAVVAWIEANGGWDETLLILTADHDCGLIWGPQSDRIAFQPIEDRGAGNMPGLLYHSGGHSNSLVPLMARGPGSQCFAELIKGRDQRAAEVWSFCGRYVDNTDVFKVMKREVTGASND